MSYHKSVLVEEVITFLAPQPYGVYVDATFGGGGHTRAILQAEPTCQVIAFDWDQEVIEMYADQFEAEFPGRVRFVWANFAQLWQQLKKLKITHVDGILADFGTSQYQIMHKKGLSFMHDSPLDMRLSPAHQHATAAFLVNELTEQELAEIFWEYGEERHGRQIARAIVAARSEKPISTTGQLAQIVMSCVKQKGPMHPATKVFQALRIAVNKELENIKSFLSQAVPALRPQGRLVCISFHSLEDRIVKQYFNDHKDKVSILTPQVITAQTHELETNPSARSARLRAALKI